MPIPGQRRNNVEEGRYNRLYQENTLFTSRLTMFFIAESILFVSYISSVNAGLTTVNISIACLGVAVSLAFWLVFYGHHKFIENIKRELDKHKQKYSKDYNDILGLTIPSVFTLIWLFLFIQQLV